MHGRENRLVGGDVQTNGRRTVRDRPKQMNVVNTVSKQSAGRVRRTGDNGETNALGIAAHVPSTEFVQVLDERQSSLIPHRLARPLETDVSICSNTCPVELTLAMVNPSRMTDTGDVVLIAPACAPDGNVTIMRPTMKIISTAEC